MGNTVDDEARSRSQGSVCYDNTGRVVLVTGGSNGIGKAICDAFASSGAMVVCADVTEAKSSGDAAQVVFRRTDTSSEKDCEAVVRWTVETYGGLDVLVNNAAIQPKSSYVVADQLESGDLERMTGVNFFGYAYMAKYALRQMKLQQSGVVINLASGQGHRTARQVSVYGPIKAANILQAMQWGVEYARDASSISFFFHE